MSEPTVYSLAQAAQVLGVHYETVARWVRTGRLAGVKLSRRKVVVPKENLDAFLARRGNGDGSHSPTLPGLPQWWLGLVGTLTPDEAQALRASAQDFEKLEEEV
jgi:excisionase family DNA binding protein